jgi:hypothetical protein
MEAITTEKQLKYYPKTISAIKLVNAGESPETALKIVNNKDTITRGAVSHFKKKLTKYALTRPKIQKLADDQITRILKGESREITQRKVTKDGKVIEYQEVIPCTDTNITSVLGYVLERTQPAIRQNQNLNVNVDVHPVDLSLYLNRQNSVPQVD